MELDKYDLYDYARRRIRQKKQLYFHFILFLTGSLFLFIINKWLNIGEPENWFVWAILGWAFLFLLHFIKVFITDSFMNKNWERSQIDRLVALQQKKLRELEQRTNPELQ